MILASVPLLLLTSAWPQSAKWIADGHYRRAQASVETVLHKNPQDVEALIALSTIQWSYGQLELSVATAEKAVAAADGSALAHAQLVNALGARLASARTGTMEKMGLSRRFRKEADLTLQLDPKNLHAHEALIRYYWYAPAWGGGDKAKARQLLDELIRLESTRGYALKAELDAAGPDKSKALAAVTSDWKQAVAAAPASYIAHAGLAGAFLDTGEIRGAEEEGKAAQSLDPSRIAAYRVLASVYASTQQWEKLAVCLRQAQTAVPDDLSPAFTAALAILENNLAAQYAQAEEDLRLYLTQSPEGLEPTLAAAHWRLCQVLDREGRRSTALQEVQIALSLDPTLEGARKDIKRLQ